MATLRHQRSFCLSSGRDRHLSTASGHPQRRRRCPTQRAAPARVWLDDGRRKAREQGEPVVDNAFLDSYSISLHDKAASYARMLGDLRPGLNEWAVHPAQHRTMADDRANRLANPAQQPRVPCLTTSTRDPRSRRHHPCRLPTTPTGTERLARSRRINRTRPLRPRSGHDGLAALELAHTAEGEAPQDGAPWTASGPRRSCSRATSSTSCGPRGPLGPRGHRGAFAG
jgi:hypothetical protein